MPARKTPSTVARLFAGRPGSRALFGLLKQEIMSHDGVEMEVTKTQVSFGAARKFAWVWLPQMWTKTREENSVTLALDLGYEVKDKAIADAVETRPGHWTHHVVISKEKDLTAKVRGWIKEAHAFGLVSRRAKTVASGKKEASPRDR